MILCFFTILVGRHTTQSITETTSIMQSISTNLPLHMIRFSCILAPKPKYIGTTKAKGQDAFGCVCIGMQQYASPFPLVPWLYFTSQSHLGERERVCVCLLYWERKKGTFTPPQTYTHIWNWRSALRRFLCRIHSWHWLQRNDCISYVYLLFQIALGKIWGKFLLEYWYISDTMSSLCIASFLLSLYAFYKESSMLCIRASIILQEH